jgi:hypothetical protein
VALHPQAKRGLLLRENGSNQEGRAGVAARADIGPGRQGAMRGLRCRRGAGSSLAWASRRGQLDPAVLLEAVEQGAAGTLGQLPLKRRQPTISQTRWARATRVIIGRSWMMRWMRPHLRRSNVTPWWQMGSSGGRERGEAPGGPMRRSVPEHGLRRHKFRRLRLASPCPCLAQPYVYPMNLQLAAL